jgi:hypothetical protein
MGRIPAGKWPFIKNKKKGQPSMLVYNQHRWLSLSCLGLKLRLRLGLSLRKADKPVPACSEWFRMVLEKRISVEMAKKNGNP